MSDPCRRRPFSKKREPCCSPHRLEGWTAVDLKDSGDGGETVNVPVPIVFVNSAEIALYSDSEMKTEVKKLAASTRMENTIPSGN